MPEHALHDLHVGACRQSEGGGTVAQVVQPDRRQPGTPDQFGKPGRDVGRVQRTAVGLGEQQIAVNPVTAKTSLIGVLTHEVITQDEHCVGIQRDQTFGRRGLRFRLTGLPPVLHDLVRHLKSGRVQVRIGPALPARLTAAQPDVGNQVEQRVQAIGQRVIKESPGLLSGPHHHRRRNLTSQPPPRNALRRPQLRLRPIRRRQLHQRRHVHRQQPLLHRRAQHRPQRLPNPANRSRTDRPLPLHRRDLPRITALPVLLDQIVVLNDRVEHPLQMPNPKPVPPEVPEMRTQVETHMGLVGAVGVAASRLPFRREEGGEHLVHQRVLQHLSTGPHQPTDLVYLRQLLLRGDRGSNHVPDLAQRVGIIVFGDRQQVPDEVEFLLRLGRGVEPATSPRAPIPGTIRRQLDAVAPLAMTALLQLRALVAQTAATAVLAGTPLKHRPQSHVVGSPPRSR
nr:hypothetical protein [Amycolatopsis sp. YIM 10]